MNAFAATFLCITSIGVFAMPRKYAMLPLLFGACYMTNAQSINIGPLHFTVLRVLLLLGFIRSFLRKESIIGGFTGMDKLMLWWGVVYVLSSFFHSPTSEALVYRLGAVYNSVGLYFTIRLFCRSKEDVIQIICATAIILVPVALEMVSEKFTSKNLFGHLAGGTLDALLRDGKIRAQGPFGHPILAGTVGGLCIPLMLTIWREHKLTAFIGIVASLGMVWASASSGPIMTTLFGVLGLALWRLRDFTKQMRIAFVVVYLLCEMFMTRHAFYLLEKIDLTGNSTGHYRAALIDSGLQYFGEWWLAGTDYTRHWMASGVSWSDDHTDITNHYLLMGVNGGFFLMIIFVAMVWLGFRYVGEMLRMKKSAPKSEQFFIWSLGSFLFAHTCTMMTVAYFDQSVMFLFLNLVAITALYATSVLAPSTQASGRMPGAYP